MAFRDWLPWRKQRAAMQALPFTLPGSENFGPGLGNQPDVATLLRESNGPFDSASRAIANRLSELELLVKVRRRTKAGTVEDEELDDHPLKLLLDRPHPNLSRSQLLFLAARHILAAGQCYWLKVSNGLRIPSELHPIPPSLIVPRVNRGVVVGYFVTDGHGKQEAIPGDVVIRCFFPDPENPWGAEGYLSPTGIEVDSHKFAGQHLRHHYQNDATPKGVFETGTEAQVFNSDALRAFELKWDQSYHSRLGNVNAPMIAPNGYTYKPITVDTREGVTPLLEYWRDNILMATATPRSVLGQVVSGDRSSAETNQYIFDRYAVKPIASLIADGLTLQLASDFDPSLIVCFEEFVSEDKEYVLKREAHDLEHALKTPNQILVERQDDENEWGDQPLIASTLGPYDPELALEAMAAPPPVPGPNGAAPANDAQAENRAHAAIRAEFKRRRKRKAA